VTLNIDGYGPRRRTMMPISVSGSDGDHRRCPVDW
jgi:hypothetical protein